MKRILLAVLFLSIALVGCTTKSQLENKYLGKRSPLPMELVLGSGHHRFELSHFDIEYDYLVSADQESIQLNGFILYNRSVEDSKYKHETVLLNFQTLEIIILFVGDHGNILAIEVCPISTDKSMVDKVHFDVTVPYKEEYIVMSTTYKFYAQGN